MCSPQKAGTAVSPAPARCPVKPTMPTAAASPSALQGGRRVLLSANSSYLSQPQHSPCCGPQSPSQSQGAASGNPSPCKQCQASSNIPSLPCSGVCASHICTSGMGELKCSSMLTDTASAARAPHLFHSFSSSQLAAFHMPLQQQFNSPTNSRFKAGTVSFALCWHHQTHQ